MLFAVIFVLYKFIENNENEDSSSKEKILLMIMPVLAVFFSAVLSFSFYKRSGDMFSSSLFKALSIIICFAGFFFLTNLIIRLILFLCDVIFRNKKPRKFLDALNGNKEVHIPLLEKLSYFQIFVISALLCFLFWLPYFLYEYPGIMTADSIVQYEQVVGIHPLSNHHPVVHTLTISFFYHIGLLFTDDPSAAIAFYTIAQMIFMAICCGDSVMMISKKSRNAALLSLLFFALVPFNAVFAVTIWKDVPFAGIVMLYTVRLIKMALKYRKAPESIGLLDLFIFALLGILLSLFRSNGFYAYVLSVPFGILFFRKIWKKMLLMFASALAIILFVKGPVMDNANIGQPDLTESLAVPIQMLTKVIVNDRALTDREKEMVDAVIDTTYIHELYAPDFADNMKELVRAGHPEVIENNKMEYLGLWFSLFAKYPADYIKSWYDLVGGYIYPDFSYEVGNIDGIMGNDYGLVQAPKIGGKVVVKGKEILIKLGSFLPLYGMLWAIGAYTWAMVICLGVMIKTGRGRDTGIIYAMPMLIIFTLLIAAPVIDFRYGYSIVMTMPLWLASLSNMHYN